jgi:trimeric autotransporter adhesin
MDTNAMIHMRPCPATSRSRFIGAMLGLALSLPAGLRAQQCDWEALMGGGFVGGVWALAEFNDGTGPGLYAGGNFPLSMGNTVGFVGQWDGREWAALGNNVSSPVFALTVFDDGIGSALYAGGAFWRAGQILGANSIARWDGKEWSALGTGLYNTKPNQPILARALIAFDDGSGPALYVGGNFTEAGGIPALNMARWDGREWFPVGEGMGGTEVRALAVYDDGTGPALYAGGWTQPVLGKWNGQEWERVGGGVNSLVDTLAVFDDGTGPGLYVGGQISSAGGMPVSGIVRWDGRDWSPLGSGTDFTVRSLHVFDDGAGPALFVGGGFLEAGGIQAWGIARWNGRDWSALGPGVYGSRGISVDALTTFDDGTGPALYVGGIFEQAGGVPADNIARWRCTPCYPDCDGNGTLDFFDFLCFQNAFLAQDPYADCDRDGTLTFFDFLCFQNEFLAGCQ